jgi:hypothetical protein
MADSKISALPAVTTVEDADVLVVVHAGTTYKITGANLKALFVASGAAATAAQGALADTALQPAVIDGEAPMAGTATLVDGGAEVLTTAVAEDSIILISCLAVGGSQGLIRVGTITPGAKFAIVSASATDTSTIAWQIVA